MPVRDLWWRAHFGKVSGSVVRCVRCGEEGDARGGWPGRHLVEKHSESKPEEKKGVEAVAGKGVAGPSERPAAASAGANPPEEASSAPSNPPAAASGPDLSFEANIVALAKAATEPGEPLHARVMARKALMEALGQFDSPPEEDLVERRKKWMGMHEEALVRINGARDAFREELSDPVKRGVVKQILAEVDS